MKKAFTFVNKAKVAFMATLLITGISTNGFSQCVALKKTVTFQPGSHGKDAYLQSRQPNLPGGSQIDITAQAWTHNGNPMTIRSLLSFDLSSIPAAAIITSAKLNLRAPKTGSNSHSQLSGSNSSALIRVLDPWDENTVTWNTQPGIASGSGSIDRVQLPAISSGDMLGIDLTDMANFWNDNPSKCHGVMIQLDNEAHYRSVTFASSDHPAITGGEGLQQVWPELIVSYEITPDSYVKAAYTDAFIESATPNSPNPSSTILGAYWNGVNQGRSYINFDLTSIPYGSTIHSATLTLFADPKSPLQHSGNNEYHLFGVSTNLNAKWEDNTLTWNNQTSVFSNGVTSGGITLPGNNLVADVQAQVSGMLTDPMYPFLSNNGFMLQVKDGYPGSLYFASSNHPDTRLHPQLVVCYSPPTNCHCKLANTDNQATTTFIKDEIAISVYPNPAKESFVIETDKVGTEYKLFNYLGQEVKAGKLETGKATVKTEGMEKGLYYININSGNVLSKKQIRIE